MNANIIGTVWTEIQRAETMLFQAAFRTHTDYYRDILASLKGPPDSVGLMRRMVSGLNPQDIRAEDYLQRYPFSSYESITAELETCVEHQLMIRNPNGSYAATEIGFSNVKTWMEATGEIMSRLPLEGSLVNDAQTLVSYDHRVVSQMVQAASPENYPILTNRMQGLYPDYQPLKLWHHWQLVWTMLAAREDASWKICRKKGIEPLAFFIHRQLWFRARRPWRARRPLNTLKELADWTKRYSPLICGVKACGAAIKQLKDHGWINHDAEHNQLNEEGLAAGDAVESDMNKDLLNIWPELTMNEFETWRASAQRLNIHFNEIIENL